MLDVLNQPKTIVYFFFPEACRSALQAPNFVDITDICCGYWSDNLFPDDHTRPGIMAMEAKMNGQVEKQTIMVKVAILGDSQIGKTTLMVKYIEDKFDEEFIETLGLNVMEKSFEMKNCIANLSIYDLGGQRQFAELMPTALDQTKAVVFAFNLIQQKSLSSVKKWYKDARKINKVFKPLLVGTKYDLFEQKEESYKSEIAETARKYARNMHSPLSWVATLYFESESNVFESIRYFGYVR